MINMNDNNIILKRNYLELKEWEAILEKTDHFFEEVWLALLFKSKKAKHYNFLGNFYPFICSFR